MQEIYQSLTEFFINLAEYLNFGYILIGALSLLFLVLVLSMAKTFKSYEVKLLRSVNKLNRYFLKEPYITEENLIKFNRKMKSVPKTLRYRWQEFMIDREHVPSHYMNTTTCVDQPSRASGYANVVRSTGTYVNIIAFLSLLFISVLIYGQQGVSLLNFYVELLLIPVIVFVIGSLFVIFLRTRHTSIVSDLYFAFSEFERNINKASTTLPQYIDYEVLFTAKEIREGIPVLKEYLEKKALQQKLDEEEAELNALKYEDFDFADVGIENSLLLERAMLESEKYFKIKQDLTDKIKAKDLELSNYQKSFEEVTRDYERKVQASRETMQQLRDGIANTTARIEANYLRKSYNEEQQRFQQIEKDHMLATDRFNKQVQEINEEISAYKTEIERRKKITQDAMMAEGKTYAKKIYDVISEEVQLQSRPYLEEMQKTQKELEDRIEGLVNELQYKNAELETAKENLQEVEREYQMKVAGLEHVQILKEYLTSDEFKTKLLSNNTQTDEEKERLKTFNFEKKFLEEKIRLLEERLNIKEVQSKTKTVENEQLKIKMEDISGINKTLESEIERLSKQVKSSELIANYGEDITENKPSDDSADDEGKVATRKTRSREALESIESFLEAVETEAEKPKEEEKEVKEDSKEKPKEEPKKEAENKEEQPAKKDDKNAEKEAEKETKTEVKKEEPKAEVKAENDDAKKEEPKAEPKAEAEVKKAEPKKAEAKKVETISAESADKSLIVDVKVAKKTEKPKVEPKEKKPVKETKATKEEVKTRKPRAKPLKRKSEPVSNRTKRTAVPKKKPAAKKTSTPAKTLSKSEKDELKTLKNKIENESKKVESKQQELKETLKNTLKDIDSKE